MLHPSYTELMEKINSESNNTEEPTVNSRYSIVIASSKRAREIIAGADPLVKSKDGEKPLSIAVKELYDSKVKILPEAEAEALLAAEETEIELSVDVEDTTEE